jgi:hypothetical protein
MAPAKFSIEIVTIIKTEGPDGTAKKPLARDRPSAKILAHAMKVRSVGQPGQQLLVVSLSQLDNSDINRLLVVITALSLERSQCANSSC